MILTIFTIHDAKANAFLPPFFLPKQAQALREFGDCIRDENHKFSRHPEDYTLFELGEFSDETANIKTTDTILSLGNGLVFIEKDNPLEEKSDEVNTVTPIQSNT